MMQCSMQCCCNAKCIHYRDAALGFEMKPPRLVLGRGRTNGSGPWFARSDGNLAIIHTFYAQTSPVRFWATYWMSRAV
jgi:hypothetical protein